MPPSASKHPFRYHAFGLTIDSSIELTTFREAADVRGEVVYVTEDKVDSTQWESFNNFGDQILGHASDTMRFKVDRGREITFDPMQGADMTFLRAVLSGELFSVLLRQRGLLTLHASAVAIDGHAIGFIGGSGYGKSTIATRIASEAGTLLTDDVLAVDVAVPHPSVFPGQLEAKLNSDSSATLGYSAPSERRAHSFTDKRLYVFDSAPPINFELKKLYLLEPKRRASNAIVPVSNSDAALELIRHTRGAGMLKAPEFIKAHLHQCETLTKSIPIDLLHRTVDLRDLDELCLLVLEDVHDLVEQDAK